MKYFLKQDSRLCCLILVLLGIVLGLSTGMGLIFSSILFALPIFILLFLLGAFATLTIIFFILFGCRVGNCICKTCVTITTVSALGLMAGSLLNFILSVTVVIPIILSFILPIFFWITLIGIFMLIKCAVSTLCSCRDEEKYDDRADEYDEYEYDQYEE